MNETMRHAVIVEPMGTKAKQNAAAEQAVVAACLISPDAIYETGGGLRAVHFGVEQFKTVYEAIDALANASTPIDVTTVAAWLLNHGKLDSVGGIEGLEKIRARARDVAHIRKHSEIVQQLARMRATLAEASKILAEGTVGPGDIGAWLEKVGARLENAAAGVGDPADGITANDGFQLINQEWATPGAAIYMSTGFPRLDPLLGGLRPQQLICVGAYSKHGKTAFAAAIADHVACNERVNGQRCGVAYFTLEMSYNECLDRMWATKAGINNKLLLPRNRYQIDVDQSTLLGQAQGRLREAPLKIYDRPGASPSTIRASLRRLAAQWKREGTPLRVAVIDYIGLLTADRDSERRRDSREQEVASISRALKAIASELNITLVLLCQLNDDGKREGRPPRATDLRESRALLFDANAVVIIYNPSVDDRSNEYKHGPERFDIGTVEPVDIIVGAVRGGGEQGKTRLNYRPGCTRFEEWNGRIEDLPQQQPAQQHSGSSRYARKNNAPTPPGRS